MAKSKREIIADFLLALEAEDNNSIVVESLKLEDDYKKRELAALNARLSGPIPQYFKPFEASVSELTPVNFEETISDHRAAVLAKVEKDLDVIEELIYAVAAGVLSGGSDPKKLIDAAKSFWKVFSSVGE